MKILKVIFAAIICNCVQTANTSHDGEFIDPTDMEHYDQSTKSLKFTLKEKESHKMFKALLQKLLTSATRCGPVDEENHYDAEVILTTQALVEISNFLKDKPCDPEVLKEHLNTIFINFKKHNEDEWKLKFKELFQMDITKVPKLRIIEDMFSKHFQRILENTQKTGQADEENHYDAEVILTRQAHVEISNFLKDKPCDSEVVKDHLNTILINIKKHNEEEWKLKFKEFFQMDITKVPKLRIIEDMVTKHFKRILENAQKTGQKAIMDGKIHLDDIEMEINKFLNNEEWDPYKLEIILENLAFNKDEGEYFWICFQTLVLVSVTYYASTWIMKTLYLRAPAQNEGGNRAEEPEDEISPPTPETGEQNKVIQNLRSKSQSEPDAEQDQMDECPSQHLQMSHKFTQDENEDKSLEQDNLSSVGINQADTLMHWNERRERQEHTDISNAEESIFFRTLETTVQNDAIQSVRGDEEDIYSAIHFALQKLHQNEHQESYEQECLSEQLNQSSLSPNLVEIKDENSVETNQRLSHTLVHRNERQEHVDILQNDAIESVRSEIQRELGALQDDEHLDSDGVLQKSHQNENQESNEHASLPELLNQSSSSLNVVEIRDNNSEETNQMLLHFLGPKTGFQRTNSTNLSDTSDTKAASAEKGIVDIVLDTHYLQDTSMSVDEESDFILLNESSSESLSFL